MYGLAHNNKEQRKVRINPRHYTLKTKKKWKVLKAAKLAATLGCLAQGGDAFAKLLLSEIK